MYYIMLYMPYILDIMHITNTHTHTHTHTHHKHILQRKSGLLISKKQYV